MDMKGKVVHFLQCHPAVFWSHECNCPDRHLGSVCLLSKVSPLLCFFFFFNAPNCLDKTSRLIMLFRFKKDTEKYHNIGVKHAVPVLHSYCCLDNNDNRPEASVNREPQAPACWNSPIVPVEVLTDERGGEEVQFWAAVLHRLLSDIQHLAHAYPQNLRSANGNQMWGCSGTPTSSWQGQVVCRLIWVGWAALRGGDNLTGLILLFFYGSVERRRCCPGWRNGALQKHCCEVEDLWSDSLGHPLGLCLESRLQGLEDPVIEGLIAIMQWEMLFLFPPSSLPLCQSCYPWSVQVYIGAERRSHSFRESGGAHLPHVSKKDYHLTAAWQNPRRKTGKGERTGVREDEKRAILLEVNTI